MRELHWQMPLNSMWRDVSGHPALFHDKEETKAEILEDGSLSSTPPSSDADIPDSQLIQVMFDDTTYFYMRGICDDGENFEDVEAGFQDLKEKMSVDLKGSFKDGVFYATEIRMPKIS